MIIKLYTPDNRLHIIENVVDVIVHLGTFEIFDYCEMDNENFGARPFIHASLYYEPISLDFPKYIKLIDYRDEAGDHRRIAVENLAYVCNNSGKTLEKVIPSVEFTAKNK